MANNTTNEISVLIRNRHSKRGHKLKVESFCSNVKILKGGPGTFEICSCGWSGWLSTDSIPDDVYA